MTTATSTSMDRYLKFVEKVSMDADLTRDMQAVEPGNTARVLELAATAGYSFTPEELHEVSREAKTLVHLNENELSEQELDMVDGGSIGGWILHKVRQAVDWIDNKVNPPKPKK